MKKLRAIALWVLAAAAVGLIAALMEMDPGMEVQTAKAKSGEIRAWVEDRAKTRLPRTYEITMPLDGRVEPITLEPGTPVAKGQMVARLDVADLDAAVTEARSKLEEVQSRLAVAENLDLERTALGESQVWITAMQQTGQAADEVIKANEASRQFSQWWLQAVQKLSGEGAVAEEKLRRAQLDDAQAVVNLATSKLVSQVIWTIKTAIDLGPKYMDQFIGVQGLRAETVRKELPAAQAALDKALRDRARAEMASPAAGIVLERYVENERFLPAGTKLLDVGRLEDLEVEADILSQDAARVHPGDEAIVFGEAVGEAPLRASVSRVDPRGFVKTSSLGVEQQRVNVILKFAPGDLDKLKAAGRALGAAYRVQVRIFTGKADKALVVPRMALFQGSDGSWKCFVARAGKAEEVTVSVGLMNENQAQVLKGLSEGDQVVVSPPKALTGGTKVRVTDADA